MARRRYIWDSNLNELVEVTSEYQQPPRTHFVQPDTPDYVSPVTGLVVSGRRQRRDDLARNNCRPWEGMQAERKEANRRVSYREQSLDRKLEESARRSYYELPPEKRRVLERE